MANRLFDLLNLLLDFCEQDSAGLGLFVKPFLDDRVLLRNLLRIGSVSGGFYCASKLLVRLSQKTQSRAYKNAVLELQGLTILQDLASHEWPKDGIEPWQQVALAVEHPPSIEWNVVLGAGSFGVVYAGQYTNPTTQQPCPVAVKEITLSSSTNLKLLKRELVLHTIVTSPQVIQFYGTYALNGKQYIVTERAPQGDLLNYIQRNKGRFQLYVKSALLINAARALQALHLWQIAHRDVKSNNFLVFDHNIVKITDFSISRADPAPGAHATPSAHVLGTLAYLAPEQLRPMRTQPTLASDIYSFGFVIWELIEEKLAYAEYSSPGQAPHLVKLRQQRIASNLDPLDIDPECIWAPVLRACWANSPADRPLISGVIAALQKVDQQIYQQTRL